MSDDVLSWRRAIVPAVVLSLPGLGFWLPFLGPWMSMLAVMLAVPWAAPRLWGSGRRQRLPLPVLGIAALWLPGLLAISFLLLFGEHLGSPGTSAWLEAVAAPLHAVGMTYWLFLPLAGPVDPWTPAAVALAALVAGSVASARLRRPAPWLLGAAAAPLAYALTVVVLDIRFIA